MGKIPSHLSEVTFYQKQMQYKYSVCYIQYFYNNLLLVFHSIVIFEQQIAPLSHIFVRGQYNEIPANTFSIFDVKVFRKEHSRHKLKGIAKSSQNDIKLSEQHPVMSGVAISNKSYLVDASFTVTTSKPNECLAINMREDPTTFTK